MRPTIGGLHLVPVALYLIGALVFFRAQLLSHFDLVFGDTDTLLVAFLHEHVYRWLCGDGFEFLSPPFFFDQTKTLGYSDALLLDQIIYTPLRLLGAEPPLALSLFAIILSPVAYLFLYLFLRRLDVSVPLASLAALIFTFPNNLYLELFHFQFFAVYYIPIVAYCGLRAVSEVHQRPVRAYLIGAFAGGLCGGIFSTGYYMAWFFGLGLLIFTPIAGYMAWPQVQAWWRKHPTRTLGLVLAASVGFVGALSIFAVIYAPVLAAGAKRRFAEYVGPEPIDIVNVGTENLIWSGLIRSLHLIDDGRLASIGAHIALTPGVQILLLASAILVFRSRFWPASDIGKISRAFVIASASVCAAFFLLTIKVNGFSLFHVLYAIVPGANAIRVGYRIMIVANLFAVTAIGLTFDRVIRLSLREPRTWLRLGQLGALTAVLSLPVIEQVNLDQTAHLSRKFERQYLSALSKAPRECRTFYMARQSDRNDAYVQEDAMRIAQAQHLPTINGDNGLFPPRWDIDDPGVGDYERRAVYWAVKRGIAEGLCRADVESGNWTLIAVDRDWICDRGGCLPRISFGQSHEFEINLAKHGNSASFTDDHWPGLELWGQWTGTTQAALSFSIGVPRDLVVALSIRPLLSAAAPKQSAWVEANRCWIGGIEFDLAHGSGPRTISGTIPADCIDADGEIVLRINTDRVRRQKDIGLGDDMRWLGVGVARVLIRELSLAEH